MLLAGSYQAAVRLPSMAGAAFFPGFRLLFAAGTAVTREEPISNQGIKVMKQSPYSLPLTPDASLRPLALTVEETAPGQFRWRILEAPAGSLRFEPLACAETVFADYDAALATGYGELQRLIGPDLRFGPRQDLTRRVAVHSAG
jgi:hypothetical protein